MVSAQAVEPVAAVLVVDDSEPRRTRVRAMLAPLGHTVVEAGSGDAALTAVLRESFAVILIAVRAPASYAIAGRLREEARSATTPIIFITEDTPDEDESDAAYAGGPVDFMSTPLRANILQAKVWTFVALHLQAQQLRRSRQSITGLNVALNASEVRARTVLEHVADGIVTTSEGGLIESFNASAQRLFGYSEDEIVGQPFQLVLAPSHRDGFFYPGYAMWMLPSANEPASQRLESEGARKNGSTFPIELDLSLMQIEDRTLTVFCIRDISGRKAHTDALEHRALHDDLTGLPNRTLFCDRIDRTLASAGRASESRALLVVDLNRFREFNATHGREQGDTVLQEVAGRLRAAIRDWHTVARLGDDEFGILPSTPTGVVEASVIAWNVRQAFERPFHVGTEEVSLDASIGVAFYPQHGRSTVDLLRRAELAMHQAKRAGSGLTVFVSDPADQTARRMSLLNELREAIPKGELVLHFQPKVDLTGDPRTTGVEALVRWKHPTEGLLMPDRFIPEAECTELIEPLTNWVLDTALGQLRAWDDQGLHLSVAVNVSAHSLTPGSELPATVAGSARSGASRPSGWCSS
jgi:diguanylate cyclase (GGDEF)-like protein/PAS domain S-box-containing protein